MINPVLLARRSPSELREPGPLEQPRAGRLARRLSQLYAGLVLYGVTDACLIRARLGNTPWDVLHQGIAGHLGVSIGAATIAVSLVVVLAWVPLREMPGLGTLSNALIVGPATNLGLAFLHEPHALAGRIALMAAGIAGNAVATAMYIGARLGPGSRDGLMTGLHRRTGRPIWMVRTSIEAGVVVLGWLLGGVFGLLGPPPDKTTVLKDVPAAVNYPAMFLPVVLSTCAGMSPSCRSPVVSVPDGSNIRIEPPGDEGLCSVPLGTTNISPARRLTVRSRPSSRSATSNWPSSTRKNSSVFSCTCQTWSPMAMP